MLFSYDTPQSGCLSRFLKIFDIRNSQKMVPVLSGRLRLSAAGASARHRRIDSVKMPGRFIPLRHFCVSASAGLLSAAHRKRQAFFDGLHFRG
jgi:hypothetical protein